MSWAARLHVEPTCYVPVWVSPGLGTPMHWAEPARASSSGMVPLEQKLDLTGHLLGGRLALLEIAFILWAMNFSYQRVTNTVTEVMPLVHWQSSVLSSRWGCTGSPLKPGAARTVGTVFLFSFFPSFSLYLVFSVCCCYYCFLSLSLFPPPPILSFLSLSLPSFLFIPNFLPLLF